MKKYRMLFILAILLVTGCDDFVDVGLPGSQLTGPVVFTDDRTATAALMDIYARMRQNGMLSGNALGSGSLMGLYSDEFDYYGSSTEPGMAFFSHTVTPQEAALSQWWAEAYSQVYAANALIAGIDTATGLTPAVAQQLRGEALFIRALLHFYLTAYFGDIPYVTSTDYRVNAGIGKMAPDALYSALSADLENAQQLLITSYPTPEPIRANAWAAIALASRVSLWYGHWDEAIGQANAIIAEGGYSLEANINDVFLKESSGTILAWHPGTAGGNTLDAAHYIFTSTPPPELALSGALMDAFEPGDQRKEAWTATVPDGDPAYRYPYKYRQPAPGGSATEYSTVLRLEEQYLIRAEASAHAGDLEQAKADLNTIRSRAGLAPTTVQSQAGLLTAILHERRVEFFAELGHRWMDLRRTGTAAEVLSQVKPAWEGYQILLPLPATELLLNPNLQPQNPGY